MITATLKSTSATIYYFDLKAMTVKTRFSNLDGEATEKDFEKKFVAIDEEKFLKADNIVYNEARYAMTESDFIKYSTNNKIKGVRYVNRTLHDTIAKCLYFDLDTMGTIEEEIQFKGELSIEEVNAKMSKGKYEGSLKFLKVLSVRNFDTMFSVSELDFRVYGNIIEG